LRKRNVNYRAQTEICLYKNAHHTKNCRPTQNDIRNSLRSETFIMGYIKRTTHKVIHSYILNYSFLNARLEYYSMLQILQKEHKKKSKSLQQTEQAQQLPYFISFCEVNLINTTIISYSTFSTASENGTTSRATVYNSSSVIISAILT
jgi:hypothetical protein